MFDGKSLEGWQANEHQESWKVVNGAIVGDGPQNRYLKGYLALQQHNAGSVVQYRNLMMRPLPVGQK